MKFYSRLKFFGTMKHSSISEWYGMSFSFFSFVLLVVSEQFCPPPDVPEEGSYVPTQNKFSAGDDVFYSCKSGFTLLEESRRRCLSSGAWSRGAPFCDRPTKLRDPTVKSMRHGSISHIIDDYPNTCFVWYNSPDWPLQLYLVEQGIVLAIKIFLEKGPTKIVIYASVKNGWRKCADYARDIETSQWVLIKCDNNTIASNKIKIESVADRQANLTICEIQAFVKDEYHCDKPPESRFDNGYLKVSRKKATLICEEGYKVKNSRIVCEGNSWKNPGAKCEEILCNPFVYNSSLTPKGEWKFLDIVNKLSAGTRRQLKCNVGYESIGGPTTVHCQKNGTWTWTNATCTEKKQKTSTTIIFAVVGAVIAILILSLLGVTICLLKRQRNREIVVVYKSTDGSLARSSESEYATAYYETVKPNVPSTPRPPVLPPILNDGYSLPEDSRATAKRKPMPADIAFGTLKQSTLYGQ